METETGRELFAPSERDRLLTAMAELCLDVGFAEMTIEGLVERAGVSREKFSELFDDDKAECLVAAVNTIMGETVSVVSGAYSADTSELDSTLLGVKAILELMAAQPSYANLGYIVARQGSPRRVGMIYDTGIMVLVVMLERLRGYGEGEAAPPKAARAALGGGEAVVRREISADRVEELPRLLPDLVYGATVAFLGQEDALGLSQRAREMLGETRWG
jgi:AcrR family transcriptional regulator